MRRKRTKLSLSITMALSLLAAPMSSAESTGSQKVDYLALGDSLAFGQAPNGQNGNGYADYLSSQLDKIGVLASFNKQFSANGYTTTNILNDIQNNVVKNGVPIQTAIKDAEIITIDAGANDLLQQVEINRETYEVKIDQEKVTNAFAAVAQNLVATFTKIKELNPSADIYVMGYYNPLPYLPNTYQAQLLPLLDVLNKGIADAAKPFGATFVPTAESIAKNAFGYLPNFKDIHPNQAGYLVLANDFWKVMNVKEAIDFHDHVPAFAKEEIDFLVKKGIISGYGNGNFGTNDPITREQSAIMLNRAIVFSNESAPNPNYTDVTERTVGFQAIAKMTQQGIFAGNNQSFNPGSSLTRAEMARVLVQAFGLKGTGTRSFNDVSSDYWAASYISILAENDITVGYSNGAFKPKEPITRAEFSMMLARALNESFK